DRVGERRNHQPVVAKDTIRLIVRASKNDDLGYRNLDAAVPLAPGDFVKVSASIPPRVHVALFSVGTDGKTRLLMAKPPGDDPSLLHYPDPEGDSAKVIGDPGTEALIILASASEPISEKDGQQLMKGLGTLAPFADRTVLLLRHDKAAHWQKDRPLGKTITDRDPVGEALNRLESLRLRLERK